MAASPKGRSRSPAKPKGSPKAKASKSPARSTTKVSPTGSDGAKNVWKVFMAFPVVAMIFLALTNIPGHIMPLKPVNHIAIAAATAGHFVVSGLVYSVSPLTAVWIQGLKDEGNRLFNLPKAQLDAAMQSGGQGTLLILSLICQGVKAFTLFQVIAFFDAWTMFHAVQVAMLTFIGFKLVLVDHTSWPDKSLSVFLVDMSAEGFGSIVQAIAIAFFGAAA